MKFSDFVDIYYSTRRVESTLREIETKEYFDIIFWYIDSGCTVTENYYLIVLAYNTQKLIDGV